MTDGEMIADQDGTRRGLLAIALKQLRLLVALAPLDPLLALLVLATLARLNAADFRLGDLISFFVPLMFYASLAAAIAALYEPKRLRLLIALGLTVANALPLLTPAAHSAPSAAGPELTVATSNILAMRPDYSALIDWSTNSGIDVLGQQEVNARELAKFGALRSHFSATPPDSVLGRNPEVTAWANWQILSASRVKGTGPVPDRGWGGAALRLALAPPGSVGLTQAQNPAVIVYVLHPASPHTAPQWDYRNAYLDTVAHAIAAEPPGLPIIAMGDFNTPVWSPFFARFLKDSGLVDASGSNWPATTRFFREIDAPTFFGSPVDHILVSPNIEVKRFDLGPDIGSDHLPVLATLRLP